MTPSWLSPILATLLPRPSQLCIPGQLAHLCRPMSPQGLWDSLSSEWGVKFSVQGGATAPHFALKMHLSMNVSLLPSQEPFGDRDSLRLSQKTSCGVKRCMGIGSKGILGMFIWGRHEPGRLPYSHEAAGAARSRAGVLLSNSLVPASFWLSPHSSSSNY